MATLVVFPAPFTPRTIQTFTLSGTISSFVSFTFSRRIDFNFSVTSAKNINKAGLRLANLVDDEDEVVFADLVDLTRDFTVVATNNLGKVVNIPKDELPLVGRTAAGVKVFAKSKSDVNEAEVVSVSVAKEDDDTVIFVTKEGRGKLVQLDKFPSFFKKFSNLV